MRIRKAKLSRALRMEPIPRPAIPRRTGGPLPGWAGVTKTVRQRGGQTGWDQATWDKGVWD